MKTWHYSRTDTMPVHYTLIMIKSAGAKFPPEYSDCSLIVKTQCVKPMWLSGNCRASPGVSVISKTWFAWLIQSSLQQPLQQHSSGCISVCPACFIPVTVIVPHSTYLTYHHRHVSVMEMGHLLTCSVLTYPEVSSKICHDSFCQSESTVSLPWVIYCEAFYLHVVSIFSCIPVICPKLLLFLNPLQFVYLFCNLSKRILLFFSCISSLLLLFFWHPLL